jgi:hypothetical protein
MPTISSVLLEIAIQTLQVFSGFFRSDQAVVEGCFRSGLIGLDRF